MARSNKLADVGLHTRDALDMLLTLTLIVGGNDGSLVQVAVTLATAWRLPGAIVDTVIVAALTSLPNACAAARLALHGARSGAGKRDFQ